MLEKEENNELTEKLYANAMKLEDFEIGQPFIMSGNKWLCVDKGTWCIVAIRLGPRELIFSQTKNGERIEGKRTVILTEEDCKGPPYSWGCSVIDEYDFPACSKTKQ